MKKIFFLSLFTITLTSGCLLGRVSSNNQIKSDNLVNNLPAAQTKVIKDLTPTYKLSFLSPLVATAQRTVKKSFGIYVTSKNSPIQPERFSGYHTGVDWEIFDSEKEQVVTVSVICEGKLLQKRWAGGYGGVAIQSCQLDGHPVTVIYGHLQLASIIALVGQELKVGERLGVLGQGDSTETDGERKHLHLGVHLGSEINLRGYVARSTELVDWLDPQKLFK